jgi:hypothetical protein
MEKTGCFDPAWRDDIFDERALALPNNRIRVKKKVVWGEEIFGTYHEYKKPGIITAILKKSPRSDLYVTRDLDSRELFCEGRIDLKEKKKWPEIILVSFDFFLRSVIITSNGEKT